MRRRLAESDRRPTSRIRHGVGSGNSLQRMRNGEAAADATRYNDCRKSTS